MKLKPWEVRVENWGIKLAEWTLLIVLAVFSAAMYEGLQALKDKPAQPAQSIARARTT